MGESGHHHRLWLGDGTRCRRLAHLRPREPEVGPAVVHLVDLPPRSCNRRSARYRAARDHDYRAGRFRVDSHLDAWAKFHAKPHVDPCVRPFGRSRAGHHNRNPYRIYEPQPADDSHRPVVNLTGNDRAAGEPDNLPAASGYDPAAGHQPTGFHSHVDNMLHGGPAGDDYDLWLSRTEG